MQKRKILPHIDLLGYYQFVTFRTYESLDHYIMKVREENIERKKREYIIDRYLDSSLKGAYLNGKVLLYLKEFLFSLDGDVYDLVAFVVMPNHVHILFRQIDSLDITMQKIKGGSALGINKILNRRGKFWESNYYDRVIRDEKQFRITYDYIKYNALRADLDDWEERFFGIYE